MIRKFLPKLTSAVATLALLLLPVAIVQAENEGQADLDKATEKKLEAKTLGDLGEVIMLCESALEKGLDDGSTAFAKQLLGSTLLQRGTLLTNPIFEQSPPAPQWPQLRTLALADLEKAVEAQPEMGEAHLLIAKLQALPRGDKEKALAAVDKAIAAFDEDKAQKSEALVLRAGLREDTEKRIADLNKAIEIDPGNEKALRLRGALRVQAGEHESGLADLMQVLELNPEDVAAHRAAAEALASLDKFDKALEHLNKAIELNEDSEAGYILRARLYARNDQDEKAEKDLNKAIERNPRSLAALLMRAEVRARLEKYKLAEGDIDRVLELRPGLPPAILLRSGIYAAQEKYLPAIRDLQQLSRNNPENVEVRLQIAALYVADERPSMAIDVLTEVLADEPENWRALRARGDALLSIGKQKEAIEDYEAALKIHQEDDGLYNNLAWVLATSPKKKLRDGERAIELAKKACELTDYKAAHILSTLAAAYAETGDFDKAIQWSRKAVELGDEGVKEHLQAELDSYKKKEPWRELQQVKEKPKPPGPSEADLEL